jgi:two-component system sensor histidine kinase YesM
VSRREKARKMPRLPIFRISLRIKLLLMVVIFTFIPLFLCLFVLNQILSANAADVGLRNMSSSIDTIQTTIRSQTESIRKNALLILRDSNVRKLIQEHSYETDHTLQQELKSQANNIIDIVEESDYITNVIFYVNDNYSYVMDNDHYQPISLITESSWYKHLDSVPEKTMWISGDDFEGDNTHISEILSGSSPSTLAYVTKIVNISNYRHHVAILRIDYSISELQQLMQNSMTLPGGGTYLLDSKGNVILSVGSEKDRIPNPSLLTMGTSENGLQKFTHNHQIFWKYQREIEETGWKLASIAPALSFDVFSAYDAYRPLIFAAATSWLVVFVLCFFFTYSITSRIHRIINHIRSSRQQREPIPLSPSFIQDEITELADNYNHMVGELQENLQREYLLGASKRSSDLRALQAQINPHFLYNTLELIDYYAYENQPERVEEIVSKLAKFYKLSLNHGKDIYQLWQEVQLVNSYFDIQNIRYQNKITMSINIPTKFDQCEILPITLQPLVENAINHGIRQKPSKSGTISLTAHSEGEKLILILADDGVGISPELVTQINDGTLQATPYLETGSHYGIRNIDQRLKIMFGEQYGIHLSSIVNEGTVVTITIPL